MTAALTDESVLDKRLRFEDLVDREALGELCKSFHALFGIAVRIYSAEGTLLTDATVEHPICAYVNTTAGGRRACASTVGAVRNLDPSETGDVVHPCFTGAMYRVIAIDYDGRRIGCLIFGPFLPANTENPPPSLGQVDNAVEPDRARSLLFKMPRARAETVSRMAAHFKAALDLILFSGHKAFLTSQMHLLSVRESYRQLEEKTANLQEVYDKLKELDRLKSNFLATVSHELRTPLTSIIGYSEMLGEGLAGALLPEQREFVQTIHEKGEHLLSLIMSLLDLSKLESGTMSMRKRTIELARVLGEAITTVTPHARKKGIVLQLRVEGDLGEIRGDPERLRQVFINLVDNAIKFTPQGGEVSVQATTRMGDAAEAEGFAVMAPTQKRIDVRVMDTGIGIPVREREKVFDPFYQVDSSSTREFGGTGLGLSIVQRLVAAHDGTVHIEDNTPAGTVFVVSLPQLASPGSTSPID